MVYPKQSGFRMPAEWAPHSQCWMAWPSRRQSWRADFEAARRAHADLARAIAELEPVSMVCNPGDVADVSLACGRGVEVLPLAINDGWMRDIGPAFLVGPEGRVAGVDWRFNAWGWRHGGFEIDDALAARMLEARGLERFFTDVVVENGAIHVDGEGTILTTEQCLLRGDRNPGLSREDMEDVLCNHLGGERVIWLGEGHVGDETRGHVDEVACFLAPGVVAIQTTRDTSDPNFEIGQDNLQRLRAATDARGRTLDIVELPQPKRRDFKGERLILSYVNFYIANGGVLFPAFEDPADDVALKIIRKAFPDRAVIQFPALDIVQGGGGLHCVTLQQPAPMADWDGTGDG